MKGNISLIGEKKNAGIRVYGYNLFVVKMCAKWKGNRLESIGNEARIVRRLSSGVEAQTNNVTDKRNGLRNRYRITNWFSKSPTDSSESCDRLVRVMGIMENRLRECPYTYIPLYLNTRLPFISGILR